MGLQKAPISIVIIVEMGADSMKYVITSQAMMSIPESPIAYWVGNGFFKIFKNARFIRNNAASHGAGAVDSSISKSLANLAINLAASLCTYLIEENRMLTANQEK